MQSHDLCCFTQTCVCSVSGLKLTAMQSSSGSLDLSVCRGSFLSHRCSFWTDPGVSVKCDSSGVFLKSFCELTLMIWMRHWILTNRKSAVPPVYRCWVFRWFYILLRWWEWQKPKHLFKIWGDKYFLLIWPSFYFLLFTFFIWPSFSLSVYNYNKYLIDTCQLLYI